MLQVISNLVENALRVTPPGGSVRILAGPGTLAASSCTTSAAGTCTVNLNAPSTGLSEVTASWSGGIATAPVQNWQT